MNHELPSNVPSDIGNQNVLNNWGGYNNPNSICNYPSIQQKLNNKASEIFATQVTTKPKFTCPILFTDETEGHTSTQCNRLVGSECVEIYFDIVPNSENNILRGYNIGCSECMDIYPWNELFVNSHPYTTRQELYEKNN